MSARLLGTALLASALLCLTAFAAAGAAFIVQDGKPNAIIVLPERPSAVERYAAEELSAHLTRATGATLPTVSEGERRGDSAVVRICLGNTSAARNAGLDGRKLARETFVLRSTGNVLCVVGHDSGGDPLDRDTSAGTLFGVYEWLERELGVRWLWPGELGTQVPRTKTVALRAVDATVTPRLFQRYVRPGLGFTSGNPALGFTSKAAEDYARAQTVFVRRHRMGRSERMTYGHAFTDWWEKYGKDHPEWFQLYKGKRGPEKPGARFAMCVSNPGLHQQIVKLWRDKGGANRTSEPSFINAVENDIVGQCECEKCQAWDGPTPPDAMKFYAPNFKVYGTRFVSDRYARFALAIQQLAAQENPHVVVIGYVYFNYFQAPTSGVKLNENILLGFCPSAGWYPRKDDEHEWYKRQWADWRQAGARLFFRPNYFLDAYSMPFVFAHQFADDFQNGVRNGMVATDFDSLTGQWSTQGPSLYLLMRLHVTPDANPDAVLADYYAGFGPAAAPVKAYFDYWEDYTMRNRQLIHDVFYDRVAIRWRTWAKAPHRVFPPASFGPGEVLLARAAAAAVGDAEAAARVEFLKTGLAHAKLCTEVAQMLTLADPASTVDRGRDKLAELLAFRRQHEREWFANLGHNAWVEDLSWKLASETKQPADFYP
jgi:hypothetical protein